MSASEMAGFATLHRSTKPSSAAATCEVPLWPRSIAAVDSARQQRQQIEPAADQPADNRAVHPDVLQVGADRRLDAVGEGARLPFAHDLGDKADQLAAPRQG